MEEKAKYRFKEKKGREGKEKKGRGINGGKEKVQKHSKGL